MNPFTAILNFLFPKYCLGCGEHGHLVCPACLAKAPAPFEPIHPWIISVWKYRHPVIEKAVKAMKYRNAHAIAHDLAPFLYDELLSFFEENLNIEKETLYLVPIPMTSKKKRERGFNQSEILAQELWKQNKELFEYAPVLAKIRETIPQARIKVRSKRLTNQRGVFVHKKHASVSGRTYILIDDITTTGATLSEAKKVLKQAGAKKVFGLTVGH